MGAMLSGAQGYVTSAQGYVTPDVHRQTHTPLSAAMRPLAAALDQHTPPAAAAAIAATLCVLPCSKSTNPAAARAAAPAAQKATKQPALPHGQSHKYTHIF